MAIESISRLDQAIEKFGGDDDRKRLILKRTMRDYMGFDNFVKRMDRLTSESHDPDLSGNLTPDAVLSISRSTEGRNRQEFNHLRRLASGVDTAGGQLASSSLARSKSGGGGRGGGAGSRSRIEANNELMNNPKDWVDSEINSFIRQPLRNPDGSAKSFQQFREDVLGQLPGEKDITPNLTEQDIENRLKQRLGDDFEKNQYQARYLIQGQTKANAKKLGDIDRFVAGAMTPQEEKIFETLSTEKSVKIAKLRRQTPEIEQDIRLTEELLNDGSGQPFLLRDGSQLQTVDIPFNELQRQHPDIPPTDLKEIAKPTYEESLKNEVARFYDEQDFYESTADDWQEIKKDPAVTNFLFESKVYDDVLGSGKAEQILFNAIKDGRPLSSARNLQEIESDEDQQKNQARESFKKRQIERIFQMVDKASKRAGKY